MIQDISLGLLNAYKETINSYDEVLDQNGQVKPYWKGLFDTLESVGIEGLELRNQEIIKKLKKSIVKSSNKIEERANCYDPRHTIVFYNENNDIIGFVELCFSCMNSKSSNNFTGLKDKMLYQEKLFQEFGITYFEDTKEENDAYWKKTEEKDLELQLKFNKKNE